MNHSKLVPAVLLLLTAAANAPWAQETTEAPVQKLEPVTVEGEHVGVTFLPDVAGPLVYSGKKTETHAIDGGEANLAANVGRMALAHLPGINLWEMDGAGTQLNIGLRGSDPHRSIEMNMRQNGYTTNSDMFGYPENHYTVPMQGVAEVQLVRGASSLQFGPLFGGMMNYRMKDGDDTKRLGAELEQTLGSDGFFNSFNAVGGRAGDTKYYAFFDDRRGDGWRPNAAFHYQGMYASVTQYLGEAGSVSLQFSRMAYRQQIAGGQTDAQFEDDPRQSNRTRNFFRPIINIPAIVLNYELSPATRLNITTNGIWGERSSVQFINTPDVEDTIDPDTGTYAPRQIDRDFYSGFTTEARLLHTWQAGGVDSILAGGVRFFDERTKRRQKGPGTTGSDFDLSLTGDYGIDLRFNTRNYAVFAENVFRLSDRLAVTPGFRCETIKSGLDGVIDHASVPMSYRGNRNFPLFGVGVQYQASDNTQLYANVTQAYRPFLYAYITPANQIDEIDPDLKDSRGESFDVGYRGRVGNLLAFDVSAYHLNYRDRIGKLTLTDGGTTRLLTTNVGDAEIRGVEAYASLSLAELAGRRRDGFDVRLFNSLAYTHGRYTTGSLSVGGTNVSLAGNQLESTPDWIERAGIEVETSALTTSLQLSHVGRFYSDANNTAFNPTGATGVVPAYTVWDLSFSYRFLEHYSISGGINNLTDVKYFTRRITSYPGPGILPADGRSGYLSFGIRL